MIIEKELIEKAKEKLGDKNFTLIMEAFKVEDYDERDMKCCCPMHHENTPSFVYNRKKYYCHCFGCGKTIDVIDAWMLNENISYINAVRKLFEAAEIQYAFGEQYQKTESAYNYRYPKDPEPCNGRQLVEQYASKRGISNATLDAFDVTEDEHGNAVFRSFDLNDNLVAVKYRPSHAISKDNKEPKCWFQKDADKQDVLWHMNKINITEPLVITEGEFDSMAVYESGYTNVVSVLNGAGSQAWIAHNMEWLDQFQSIIICSDNDKAGQHMRDESISRLGSWRCKVVDIPLEGEYKGKKYPCKDANNVLNFYGKEYLYHLIISAKDTPVISVQDFSTIVELPLDQMRGIETGFSAVDEYIDKLFFGTVTLLTGRPGAGKSSFIDSVVANSIDAGYPAWLYSKELAPPITKQWMDLVIAGPRNIESKVGKNGKTYWNTSIETQDEINKWSKGQLYVYKDDQSNDAEIVEESMLECHRKFGCRLFIIDNLTVVNLGNPQSELENQKNFMVRLLAFAAKYDVAIVLVCHPRKAAAGESPSGDLDLDSIAGSANLGNLCQRSIALRRVSKKEKEDSGNKFSNYDVVISVIKDRITGRIGIDVPMFYDMPSRRFYSDMNELDRRYGWDTKQYEHSLPVPDKLRVQNLQDDSEVFGKQ